MAASLWHGQKETSIQYVEQSVAPGQEKPVSDVLDALKENGVSRKNAVKAVYHAVSRGTVILKSGEYDNGVLAKAGV